VPEHQLASGRLSFDAPLIAGHVSLQAGTRPTRTGGGSLRAHRSYAVRMSDWPVSPQEIRAAAAANAELGPGYRDAVVASFQE
jgi:hypothetical protein